MSKRELKSLFNESSSALQEVLPKRTRQGTAFQREMATELESVRALEAELTEARRVAQEAVVRITEANMRLSAEHERLRERTELSSM